MRDQRSARFLAVLATVAFIGAAGCGNSTPKSASTTSGGDTETTGGDSVSNTSPGVTADEIRVGGVASVTNPLQGKFGEAFDGTQAYFDMVNAEGGVFGRKLVLAAKRDDKLGNNSSEVEGLLSQDNVFAVLPVASLLFTGADKLVQQNVPTFGFNINTEWSGTAENPKLNMFGQSGSYLCFTCAGPNVPWLAEEAGAHKVGLLTYNVSQSSECGKGVQASFDEYGELAKAKLVFSDLSLTYGAGDLSVQVSKMKDAGVEFVTTCMDTNGVVVLAKEMKKQGLKAVQYLPNAYDHEFLEEFGDLFEGSYVRTDFVGFEAEQKPKGLTTFLAEMKKADKVPSEPSVAGWLNADLFVRGLKAAGPDFDRQKVIDAINKITDYDADGMIAGADWTIAHTERDPVGKLCDYISKISDSEFSPVSTKPGKPFICGMPGKGEMTARYTS